MEQQNISGLELLDSNIQKTTQIKINQNEQNRRNNFSSIKFKQKIIDLALQLSIENLVYLKKEFEKELFEIKDASSESDILKKNKLKIKIETITEIINKTQE